MSTNPLSVVVYTNPFSEWFWESGAAAWFYVSLAVITLAAFAFIYWDNRRK